MVDRRQDVLRLQPHMIPALRSTFSSAIDQVKNAMLELSRGGYLTAPWLGDETSSDVAIHYTQRAMQGPDSSYDALVSYRNELARVHDTLQQMEADYHRTEAANAAGMKA